MGNSFIANYQHVVFSTKERQNLLTAEIQTRLWPYLGGIARENKMTSLCAGGMPDHVHILLSIPTTIAISKAVQLIKGGSSKLINEEFGKQFAWQEGYGAFSVSTSQLPVVRDYINNQKEHHTQFGFQAEFLTMLKQNEIEYDERYVWG